MLFLEKIKTKFKRPKLTHIDNLSTTFFNKNNWFYQPSRIELLTEKNNIQIHSKTIESTYVNFWEGYTNFSTIKESHNKVILDPENSIFIQGKVTGNLNCTIYLIEYDEHNEQTKKHQLSLNKLNLIIPAPSTNAARLTIRISGKGELEINRIFTSPFLPVNRSEKDSIRNLYELQIAGVVSTNSASGLATLTKINRLNPSKWRNTVENETPDMILLEAAEILFEEWGNFRDRTSPIGRLLLWSKTSKIPVILWHKQSFVQGDELKGLLKHVKFILVHHAEHREWYANKYPKTSVFLIPYPAGVPTIDYFNKPPTLTIVNGAEENEEGAKSTNPINIQNITVTDHIEEAIEEQLLQGNLVICKKSLLEHPYLQDFTVSYDQEDDLQRLMKEFQTNPEKTAYRYREVTRNIWWKYNYRDFLTLISKQLGMEYRPKLPTATIAFLIKSMEEYKNAIHTLENQTAENITWLFLFTPFQGYEALMNKQMEQENMKVYIASYALTNYDVKQLIDTTYLGVLDSTRTYDAYYIEDYVQTMDYYSLTSLVDQSMGKHRVTAKFYLTSEHEDWPAEWMETIVPEKEKVN